MEIRRVVTIRLPNLTAGARPLRALVVSDMEILDSQALQKVDNKLGGKNLVVSCGDMHAGIIRRMVARNIPVVGVRGNHDSLALPQGMVDLHCKIFTFEGIKFGGFQGAWKYKPRGHFLYEDIEVERFLSRFPGVDVFVAHNPMAGIHDVDDGVHNGFGAFRNYCLRTQPKLFLHGHSGIVGETVLEGTQVLGIREIMELEIEEGKAIT